jgi:hypothetical protein
MQRAIRDADGLVAVSLCLGAHLDSVVELALWVAQLLANPGAYYLMFCCNCILRSLSLCASRRHAVLHLLRCSVARVTHSSVHACMRRREQHRVRAGRCTAVSRVGTVKCQPRHCARLAGDTGAHHVPLQYVYESSLPFVISSSCLYVVLCSHSCVCLMRSLR